MSEEKTAPKTARDELAAVYEELENKAAEAVPEQEAAAPEAEAAPETPAVERDEKGKFRPKAEAAKPEAAAAPKQDAKPDAKTEAKNDIPPPVGWRGDAKVDWKRLPASIRQELVNDYNQRQQLEQRATKFDQVLTPNRRQLLQMSYGDEVSGLNQILATVEYSNTDPAGFLKWFAQTRGINLAGFAPQQQQEATYVDPALQTVTEKLQALERHIAQQQQYSMQHQQAQLQDRAAREWNEFISDSQKHPYANDVFDLMMDLISKKLASNLTDAYDKAVHIHPETRAKVIAAQQQQVLQSQAQQSAAKRAASVSIAGAPGGISNAQAAIPMVNGRPETATETLRRTMNEMGARL